jgi:hypothetical protein
MGGRVYQAGAHGPVSYKLITSKTENCFQTDYQQNRKLFSYPAAP